MSDDQNKIKRYVRLDQMLRNSEGYTIKEILFDTQIDDISERQLRDNLAELEKVFGAKYLLNAKRGKERIWRYKDTNFTIFKQINTDVDILRKSIEKLSLFKGDPRYDMLRFFLIGITGNIDTNYTPVMSFANNSDLQGLENMDVLANAIIHHYPLKIMYKPYNKPAFITNVHPYHLRQYNNRWILFGWSEEKETIFNFPIDRIKKVEHLSKTFLPTDIDFDEYFDDVVGCTVMKNKPVEDILLKVNKNSADYIRTKPIHWSQTELKDKETEGSMFIRLKVKVNTELEMVLFSYSDSIEVISPIHLRDKFAQRIMNMSKFYEV